MVNYKHLKYDTNTKIRVDSAVRDDEGRKISTKYVRTVNNTAPTDGNVNITVPSYTGEKGISVASNKVGHTNNISSGSTGSSSSIPTINYDAQGHITSVSGNTVYAPTTTGTNGQIWTSTGSGGQWKSYTGIMMYKGSYATVEYLVNNVTSASVGDVYNIGEAVGDIPPGTNWACRTAYTSAITTATFTNYYDPLGGSVDLSPYSLKTEAVGSLSVSGKVITYKNVNGTSLGTITTQDTVYTHPSKSRSDTTSSASPAHGGTFTVVDSVTTDGTGHVGAINVKTITLPSDALGVTSVATGVGLTGGTITSAGTIKAKLKSETASTLDSTAMGSTASRQYAVGVDKSGYLSVNIPWTDTKYTHPASGVTAGTYKSVTVDTNGHVTAGTNPTTLSGYGITDAKISNGVITLGTNTITPLTSHQTLPTLSVTNSGSGNAVTAITVSNHAITVTKGTTFLTSHQSLANYATLTNVNQRIDFATLSNGTTATTTKGYTYGVAGSGTGTSTYVSPKWYAYLKNGNTALTDGMMISIKVPVAGNGTTGTLLTIDGGTTFKPVCRLVNSMISTVYAVNSIITLVYNSIQTSTGYPASGASGATTYTGIWVVANDYDANTTYSVMSVSEGTTGTATASRVMRADYLKQIIAGLPSASCTGNAGTTTKLATSRKIDGVSFDGSADIVHYGKCTTASATAQKDVTCTGFNLVDGAMISVLFSNANTASIPKLNVNGTGAKSILWYGSNIPSVSGISTPFGTNAMVTFVYDSNLSSYHICTPHEGTVGSSTKPIYKYNGWSRECSTYAGGTAVTLNGTSKGASTASFYAPTAVGTNGYFLKSSGSGEPSWSAITASNVGGGTFTGTVVAQSNTAYTTAQVRNIIISTAEPTSSVGSNGDVWLKYTA